MDSDNSLEFVASEDLEDIEWNLSSSSFIHGWSILPARITALIPMDTHLSTNRDRPFLGVRLETCASRRSIMWRGRYASYCHNFCLQSSLRSGSET